MAPLSPFALVVSSIDRSPLRRYIGYDPTLYNLSLARINYCFFGHSPELSP
nr:hypothetical protein Q903MT_gene2447 [Picea sitchensis]